MKLNATNVLDAASWLDAYVPGWYNRIDLDKLDMLHCDRCILGQLFNEYSTGRIKVAELNNTPWKDTFLRAGDETNVFGTAASKDEWHKAIVYRRVTSAPVITSATVSNDAQGTSHVSFQTSPPPRTLKQKLTDLLHESLSNDNFEECKLLIETIEKLSNEVK